MSPEDTVERLMMTDSMRIDTFYQIGAAIYQNDLKSSVEEKDWEIIKEELLRDSAININAEDLTYEEYLEAESNQLQDTTLNTPLLVIQPIVLNKELEPSKADTIFQQERHTITVPENAIETTSLEKINSRLLEMEEKLDAIRTSQGQPVKEENLTQAPTQTATTPSADIIELRKKIEQIEAQRPEQKDAELVKMKQQLFELQNKEEQKRNNENKELRAEIESLRKEINTSQEKVNSIPPQNSSGQNPEEIRQLKTEVAPVNQNIELMKQLLLQQQMIETLKNRPEPSAESKDTSNSEIQALRQEIAELRKSMTPTDKAATTVIAAPLDGNKEKIDTLRQQIVTLQKELQMLKDLKSSEPKVEKVVVEVPVAKSTDVMELIKGREKQIVFFNIGSSKLSSGGFEQTASVAQLLLQYDQLRVTLEAYTDSSGDATKNLMLSKKRAESVRAAILQYGIAVNRIDMDYRGEDAQSTPAFGRRVEMILSVN